jgi:hypothetical protein
MLIGIHGTFFSICHISFHYIEFFYTRAFFEVLRYLGAIFSVYIYCQCPFGAKIDLTSEYSEWMAMYAIYIIIVCRPYVGARFFSGGGGQPFQGGGGVKILAPNFN